MDAGPCLGLQGLTVSDRAVCFWLGGGRRGAGQFLPGDREPEGKGGPCGGPGVQGWHVDEGQGVREDGRRGLGAALCRWDARRISARIQVLTSAHRWSQCSQVLTGAHVAGCSASFLQQPFADTLLGAALTQRRVAWPALPSRGDRRASSGPSADHELLQVSGVPGPWEVDALGR